MKKPAAGEKKVVKKAKRVPAPKQSFVVLLTKLSGRKQPWCPEGWFLPTFDGGEATGWQALAPGAVPQDGLPLGPGLLAQLHDRLASWGELYPDAIWKYELVIVDSGKYLRFSCLLK